MQLSIGFSGSRLGMSPKQKEFVWAFLKQHNGEFHQGDCIGADAEALSLAELCPYITVSHPPIDPKYRAFRKCNIERAPLHYYDRNKAIIGECHYLIATPKSRVEQGGTWYTINWAKKVNRPFTIILPDGTLGHSVTESKEEVAIREAIKRWNG